MSKITTKKDEKNRKKVLTWKNKNANINKYLATDKIIKITRELVINIHNKIKSKNWRSIVKIRKMWYSKPVHKSTQTVRRQKHECVHN